MTSNCQAVTTRKKAPGKSATTGFIQPSWLLPRTRKGHQLRAAAAVVSHLQVGGTSAGGRGCEGNVDGASALRGHARAIVGQGKVTGIDTRDRDARDRKRLA